MGTSARSPEPDDERASPLIEALGAVGGALARNPTLVGGTTAFVVALSFVSANAIWYQPHFHSGAFFATRDVDYVGPADPSQQETTIRIEREGDRQARAKADPVVEKVQAILQSMNLYEGPVDGLNGPNTRKAVAAYRKTLGMAPSDAVDAELLETLGVYDKTAGIGEPDRPAVREVTAKRPASLPVVDESADPVAARIEQASATVDVPEEGGSTAVGKPAVAAKPDPMIMKIQAGLKAFGNDQMEVDGLIGSKTRSSIKEFQSLFGLKVTGEPSEEVYAKMREIGLTN